MDEMERQWLGIKARDDQIAADLEYLASAQAHVLSVEEASWGENEAVIAKSIILLQRARILALEYEIDKVKAER
jgi:hypothetical protein